MSRNCEEVRPGAIGVQSSDDPRRTFHFDGVVGTSAQFRDLLTELSRIAPTRATVLIEGETGTGKELVAKAIHRNSLRRDKPYVTMNCAALNENLLEDELFGHEPGAFTGASKQRKGRFEHANGGTLFLDEVGDMPQSLQAKLLRVLESGELTRLGSNEPIEVNIRLLSATNRDLKVAVARGQFRSDLYFRLRVVRVTLPPLRKRREDIPLLVDHFIRVCNARDGKCVQGLAEPVREAIVAHDWPGNVRELRNFIDSMVAHDTDGVLDFDDMEQSELSLTSWPGDSAEQGSVEPRPAAGHGPLAEGPNGAARQAPFAGQEDLSLETVKRRHICAVVSGLGGNVTEAAKRLVVARGTVHRYLKG